jgi:hypothetical protein
MGRAIVFSASIAAAAYLGFSFWAGWHDVASAFAAVGWSWTAYVLGLSLINYVVRFVRWQLYLSTLGHPVPILSSCMIYFAGFAFTTTPGKAGEMLRGVFLGSRGVPFVHSTAAFLSERLSGGILGVSSRSICCRHRRIRGRAIGDWFIPKARAGGSWTLAGRPQFKIGSGRWPLGSIAAGSEALSPA